MFKRLFRKAQSSQNAKSLSKKTELSQADAMKQLEELNLKIHDGSVKQELLESTKENLREKIERLRSEGKSDTIIAPLTVNYKNLGRQTRLNSEILVKLYEIQGALNLLILSKTAYSQEDVDHINDLFQEADERTSLLFAATNDLVDVMEKSEIGNAGKDKDYLGEFDKDLEEKKSKNKKYNLDEL